MESVRTAQEATEANRSNYPHGITNKAKREAMLTKYREEEKRITRQFEADLAEEWGIDNEKLHNLIYGKAWEDGHSAGYSEVYYHYQELVEFVNKVKEAL